MGSTQTDNVFVCIILETLTKLFSKLFEWKTHAQTPETNTTTLVTYCFSKTLSVCPYVWYLYLFFLNCHTITNHTHVMSCKQLAYELFYKFKEGKMKCIVETNKRYFSEKFIVDVEHSSNFVDQ